METSMATLILHYLSHGRTVKYFSNLRKNLGPGVDGWVNRYVPLPTHSKKKEKPKIGTMESFKFLVSSPYIRDFATLVVAYGIISINLVEVTWKIKA